MNKLDLIRREREREEVKGVMEVKVKTMEALKD